MKMQGMSYAQALEKGYLRQTVPTPEEAKEIERQLIEPKAKLYGLRFPEKDAKTPNDYMRITYREEDEAFLEEQQRKTLTLQEQKKYPREVLQEGWDEDMKLYSHKRKP